MATIVVVIGPPGAGKGTRISQAKGLISDMKSISTGNLIRKNGIDTSNGMLVSDELVIDLLKDEIDSTYTKIIVLDGVPRTINQAEMMSRIGIKVNRVIELPLSEEEAIRRAEDRIFCSNVACQETYTKSGFKPPKVKGVCDKCGSELIKRSDDNAETAKERMKIYHEKTEPIIEWYRRKNIPILMPKDFIDFLNALTD